MEDPPYPSQGSVDESTRPTEKDESTSALQDQDESTRTLQDQERLTSSRLDSQTSKPIKEESDIIESHDETIDVDESSPLLDYQTQSSSSRDQDFPAAEMAVSYLPQYIAALCATMGAFSMGTIIGYSSPAGAILSNYTNPALQLDDTQLSWFSSSATLGALCGGPATGFFMNSMGRRGTMIMLIIPYVVGWVLLAAAQNFAMLLLGRIVTGFCAGATSLVVPTYIGEFSSPKIRGQLGTGFQLNVTIGILFSYCMGAAFDDFRWIACVLIIFPTIFSVSMFFNKESPNYLLAKNKEELAKVSLQHFRGNDYDISDELEVLKTNLERDRATKVTLKDLKVPHVLKPLSISVALMFLQQFSGINAVLFNLQTIFQNAGSTMSDNLSSIIVGLMQVIATFAAALLMDRAGRKMLLLISSAIMALSLVALGAFFYLKENADTQDKLDVVDSIGWLPLVALIVYIIAFSIGFGPIPWLLMGEIFSSDVRELAGSISTSTNWSMAFVTTLMFNPLRTSIDDSGCYWFFAAWNVLSFIFVFVFVWETKGKTLEEITAHFGGGPLVTTPSAAKRNGSAEI